MATTKQMNRLTQLSAAVALAAAAGAAGATPTTEPHCSAIPGACAGTPAPPPRAENPAPSPCSGGNCNPPAASGGNAKAVAIVEAAKQRLFTANWSIGGPAIAPAVTDLCMKSLGLLGLVSLGNYDRDSAEFQSCLDRRAITEIGLLGIKGTDEAQKAMSYDILSGLYPVIGVNIGKYVGKIETCLSDDRPLANEWLRISSEKPRVYCGDKAAPVQPQVVYVDRPVPVPAPAACPVVDQMAAVNDLLAGAKSRKNCTGPGLEWKAVAQKGESCPKLDCYVAGTNIPAAKGAGVTERVVTDKDVQRVRGKYAPAPAK